DSEEFLMDSKNNVNEERRSLYCISIPGLNNWAKPAPKPTKLAQSESKPVIESHKRSQEDEDNPSSKRIHMDVDSEMSTSTTVAQPDTHDKEAKVEHNPTDLNLPIPDDSASACLVTDVITSSMFYLGNSFYVHGEKDYSKIVKAWAKRKKLDLGETYQMSNTCFKDLKVRLNYPYVYQHLGSCDLKEQ
ncbi:mini-chromosome maintenance complex-binding protein-like, partial [Diaphorina citri]|uniref:snRNA-activating protein complex subunit 3 n=1 Tax=Diaphorina citri TaxID=121845 RepID=A0A1S3DQG5_DIACI